MSNLCSIYLESGAGSPLLRHLKRDDGIRVARATPRADTVYRSGKRYLASRRHAAAPTRGDMSPRPVTSRPQTRRPVTSARRTRLSALPYFPWRMSCRRFVVYIVFINKCPARVHCLLARSPVVRSSVPSFLPFARRAAACHVTRAPHHVRHYIRRPRESRDEKARARARASETVNKPAWLRREALSRAYPPRIIPRALPSSLPSLRGAGSCT